jgi:hypothetical protein
MNSTACSAIVSLSATTMMPLLRSDGGRLKHGDRHVAVLGFLDDSDSALAVLRDQDDAVHALGDAVAHLFELRLASSAALRSITS